MQIGDSVKVKSGVQCPDYKAIAIGGWQGRITDIAEDGTPFIEWDSHTLRALPEEYVRQSAEEGLGWEAMRLAQSEVEPATPRDSEDEVQDAYAEIAALHAWDHLADENPGIREALAGVDPHDTMACLEAWETHLEQALQFPFEAEVVELLTHGSLRVGDRVRVTGLEMTDDKYGLITAVRRGRERFDFSLCDMEATDKNSASYQPLRDYVVWFANR